MQTSFFIALGRKKWFAEKTVGNFSQRNVEICRIFFLEMEING